MTVHASSGSSNQQERLRTRGATLHACHRAGLLRRVGGLAALLILSGSLPVGAQTVDWHAREALVADQLGTPAITETRPQRQVRGGLFGSNWVQRDKLMASDGVNGDDFGQAVALDGDTALLMACGAEGGSSGYIYTRSDDIWSEQAKLTPHPVSACGFIFAGSVALDGDTAMVATWYPLDIDETPQAGALAIYVRTGEQWAEQAVFVADEGTLMSAKDSALDGDTVLVPSVSIDNPVPVVSVFARSGGQWTEAAAIVPPEGAFFDFNSFPGVALDGDTSLIVGEYEEQPDQTIVFVFVRDGDEWTLQEELTPSDGAEELDFGYTVAIDGETALVGASRPDFGILGKVYVYIREGETWTEQAQLTAPIEGDDDGNFGRTVALDGDTALVGARGLDTVFAFSRSDEVWNVEAALTPADDSPFAYRVALDGDTILVGVNSAGPFDPDPAIPGWAYLFDTRPPAPALRLEPRTLDFGEVRVGQSSDKQAVTLTNNGGADLHVGTLIFSGDHADDFDWVDDPCSGQSIAPGDDPCTVELRFSPTAVGERTAFLDVPSNAPTAPDSALLAGVGLVGPPTIRLDPESVAAVVAEGGAADETLTVSNIGTLDLSWEILDQGVANLGLLRPRRPATVFDTLVDLAEDDQTRLTTASGDRKVVRTDSIGGVEVASQGVTITHSQSTEIVIPNTPKCQWQTTPFTTPNQFLRTFTLTDFGITDDFEVTEVSFGVESLDAEVGITVNLYTLDGALFVYENLSLLASEEVTLSPQAGTIVTVPISTTVPNGATLVMEIAAPDMLDVGAFSAGSNSAGEFAPSYLATPECGGINPTPFEYLGFPDAHLVMSVTGTLDCAIPDWLGMTPLAGTVPGGESAQVPVTLDGTGLPLGTVAANICIANNDPAKPFVIVPASLTVVEEVIPPVADISPPSLELTIGKTTDTDTRTLAIGNLGNADSLDWDLLAVGGAGGCYDPLAVPWLTVDALSGSVAPGASQAVAVTASAVLYDNGPLINRPDAGPDGTDLSVLESLTLGMDTLGWPAVVEGDLRVADDFEVLEDSDIHALTFFVHHRESPPTSTIDLVNYQIWDGPPNDPGSSVVFGDTVTNRLLATEWAGAYRVYEDDPLDTNRPIMRVVAAGGFSLPPGVYWVDAQFGDDGTVVPPPYQPPVAILGETTTGDGLRLDSNGWQPMLDLSTGAPQGMPFVIHGLPSLSAGTYETVLCISTNDPDAPQVDVPVTLTIGAAELAFEPQSVDFGEVEAGHASPTEIVTLHSVGTRDATGMEFQLVGDDFDADTSACDTTLPIGGQCEVAVTFTPLGLGPLNGTLQVQSDDGAVATVSLSGQGVPETGIFVPMGLNVDTEQIISDANGVFEAGERAPVAPIWLNDGLFAQFLEGTASDLTGPEGPAYTLLAAEADYGEVETGEMASCQESDLCYEMDIGPAGVARPAPHWDATFDEALSDDTTHTWALHLGESFVDVPRNNLFYRPVETLLHSGVTGGCSDTEYCPTGSNTRSQMAVFLLRAVEGGDYTPPPCVAGEEEFFDVSADNAFCPWIEELAARAVTAGCGGDNYCPVDSVTRAQMAVFLLRAAEGKGYTPPPCTGTFTDVPCPSTFAAWIEDLANRDVTSGCGATTYCPADTVTRAQMAVFLGKAFGLVLYGP